MHGLFLLTKWMIDGVNFYELVKSSLPKTKGNSNDNKTSYICSKIYVNFC